MPLNTPFSLEKPFVWGRLWPAFRRGLSWNLDTLYRFVTPGRQWAVNFPVFSMARAWRRDHWLDIPPAAWKHDRVKQSIVTLDMEGVLTPEIWIAVSEKTGIKELRLTTRDEPDYDKLMRGRLAILDQHRLKLSDIQQVIGTMQPLEGGKEFLDELRSLVQVI